MAPNPSTGLVTLPEVVTGELAGKFGEISLFNQHADFEFGSASNSNSTSPWAIACEPATEPSCADYSLHEHFPYGLCDASKAHAKALTACRAGKEIVSDYTSDSNPVSGYYSDSSYELDFSSDPDEPESENSTTEQPLSGPATGLVITSTPAGTFVYWPDRKPADLTETSNDKNTRRERNRKHNERRRRLRESLPIRNLTEALKKVESRVHTTPEQCLMSITTIARQAQGMRAAKVNTKLAEDA
jgi:hypothetical protein